MDTFAVGNGGDVTDAGTINGEMHDQILCDTEMEEGIYHLVISIIVFFYLNIDN